MIYAASALYAARLEGGDANRTFKEVVLATELPQKEASWRAVRGSQPNGPTPHHLLEEGVHLGPLGMPTERRHPAGGGTAGGSFRCETWMRSGRSTAFQAAVASVEGRLAAPQALDPPSRALFETDCQVLQPHPRGAQGGSKPFTRGKATLLTRGERLVEGHPTCRLEKRGGRRHPPPTCCVPAPDTRLVACDRRWGPLCCDMQTTEHPVVSFAKNYATYLDLPQEVKIVVEKVAQLARPAIDDEGSGLFWPDSFGSLLAG